MNNTRSTNAVDQHIGRRVRTARLARKISQQELGEAVGVSFQQIQKYEKGANRIGTGRLHAIGKSLSVPVTFFFEGIDRPRNQEPAGIKEVALALSTREGVRIAIALAGVRDPKIRRSIANLLEVIVRTKKEGARSAMRV